MQHKDEKFTVEYLKKQVESIAREPSSGDPSANALAQVAIAIYEVGAAIAVRMDAEIKLKIARSR